MPPAVLHTVDPNVPVHLVSASHGKAVRAEPVSALDGDERDRSWHKDLAGVGVIGGTQPLRAVRISDIG